VSDYINLSDVLTSLDFPDKPAEHDQFFPHSYSVSLNSSPYRCNLCSQIFYTIFWSNSRLEDPFSSELSLNSYHRFRWMKLQHTKRFFRLRGHLTSVLYSSGKSWNYFLRMRAKKKKKTFWVALYNCVRLIFVYVQPHWSNKPIRGMTLRRNADCITLRPNKYLLCPFQYRYKTSSPVK
jgi:hypothetical protein